MAVKLGKLVYYTPSKKEAEMLSEKESTNIREKYSAIVVHCESSNDETPVNLKVFIDGKEDLWIRAVVKGTEPGTWQPIPQK